MRFECKAALTALMLISDNLAAQGRLTGLVRDTVGAPIAGAEITVQGTARPATTNARGAFEVRALKPGPVSVSIRRLGYAPQSMIVRIVDGENTLPDIMLTAVPRQLDTVMTREQQLWRERPLLREMEDNRKLGMGQFITRADLAKNQGGFISQHFNAKRGLLVVRDKLIAGNVWLANKYIPEASAGCYALEDMGSYGTTPPKAACDYCFPTVYLDYTRLSSGKNVPNLGAFSPDQLEGIEVYLGAAETPMRYASGFSSCGVVVLHTRAVDRYPRAVIAKQDEPTRSPVFVSASLSAGARCLDCDRGDVADLAVGYTLRDRVVIAGRYASWSNFDGGAQRITLGQALMEWYPRRNPGRVKWLVNLGLGFTSIDINATPTPDIRDHFRGGTLPSVVAGTGIDVALYRRVVATPFFSMTRTFTGETHHTRCINIVLSDGSKEWQCFGPIAEPGTYNLKQLGVRFGWR